MRSRRAPIYIESLANGQSAPHRHHDPFAEVQLEKVLKELSFLRIQLDDIVLPSSNAFIQKLYNSRQLYGFQLEYSFPCLDVVSKALKATVRIPEKDTTATKIEFKHKRVVLLTMHEDQVPHWQRSRLSIHLLVQMSVNGKHTTRPLAKCTIPLYELVVAPYMICRDFDFVGDEFEGTALVRIDLGTRVKSLMEKLESLRGDRSLEDTFVVTERNRVPPARRTRSRSSSRCRGHSSSSSRRNEEEEEENQEPRVPRRPLSATSSLPSTSTPRITNQAMIPPPQPLQRHRIPSSASSIGSDSVFVRPASISTSDVPRRPHVMEDQPTERTMKTVSNSYGASTVANIIEERSYGGKYYMQLTVHQATGLPLVEDSEGRITSPCSFISVLGREGDLRSPVVPNSREPRWEFTARFAISSERRNLIIKVLHHGVTGDHPLGYVTIALPADNVRRDVFEMVDVTQTSRLSSQVPMLTISMERLRDVDELDGRSSSRRSASRMTSSQSTQSSPPRYVPPPRIESPIIMESIETIKNRMHRCVSEMENMTKRMQI